MSIIIEAALQCIQIQDAASAVLEVEGMVSTERLAALTGKNEQDVFCVMSGLMHVGAVKHTSAQVWVLANA